jgi:hypothetical protein
MNVGDLAFDPISRFPPGTLADIIGRSYADLVDKWPDTWKGEERKWADFDREAYAFPETVGRCVFVSRLGDRIVGLASYDPRPGPAYGIVGQNCVLPTSEHPFFAPALRMYRSLGFRDIRRRYGGPDRRYRLVELELDLAGRSET